MPLTVARNAPDVAAITRGDALSVECERLIGCPAGPGGIYQNLAVVIDQDVASASGRGCVDLQRAALGTARIANRDATGKVARAAEVQGAAYPMLCHRHKR